MILTEQAQFEEIADGLAKNGLSVSDNFLSLDDINNLLDLDEFKYRLLHFKKAGIGSSGNLQIKESVRGDFISWINPATTNGSLLIYIEKVRLLMRYLNQSLFLSLKEVELHLTAYPVGSFYKRHIDQFKQEDHRKVSIILYLNHHWKVEQGGQLRVYLENQTMDILPEAGKLVCMRSDIIEHEVLPTARERLSITGWMLDTLIETK
jgi:SM-20-related protein